MRLTLLSCLLAASAVFSVQGVILNNLTSKKIMITHCVYFSVDGVETISKIAITLKSFGETNTADVFSGKTIKKLTAHINDRAVTIKDLKAETILTFFENEYGVTFNRE